MSVNPLNPMSRIIDIIKKERVKNTDKDKKRKDKKQEENKDINRKIDIKV